MIGDLLNQRIVQLQLDQVGIIYLFSFKSSSNFVLIFNCECVRACVCISGSGAVPSHRDAHGEHAVSPREETHPATE